MRRDRSMFNLSPTPSSLLPVVYYYTRIPNMNAPPPNAPMSIEDTLNSLRSLLRFVKSDNRQCTLQPQLCSQTRISIVSEALSQTQWNLHGSILQSLQAEGLILHDEVAFILLQIQQRLGNIPYAAVAVPPSPYVSSVFPTYVIPPMAAQPVLANAPSQPAKTTQQPLSPPLKAALEESNQIIGHNPRGDPPAVPRDIPTSIRLEAGTPTSSLASSIEPLVPTDFLEVSLTSTKAKNRKGRLNRPFPVFATGQVTGRLSPFVKGAIMDHLKLNPALTPVQICQKVSQDLVDNHCPESPPLDDRARTKVINFVQNYKRKLRKEKSKPKRVGR